MLFVCTVTEYEVHSAAENASMDFDVDFYRRLSQFLIAPIIFLANIVPLVPKRAWNMTDLSSFLIAWLGQLTGNLIIAFLFGMLVYSLFRLSIRHI